MGFDFLSRAAKFLQEQKEYKRWLAAFLCLAIVVVFGTVTALKMYGQAMTHQVKVLDCAYQVHEHTEDCYEEDEEGEQILICGLADYVAHVHNDDCYDAKQNLVCLLEERPPHEHSDDCYEEEDILICEEEESEGSQEEAPDSQPEENTTPEEVEAPEESPAEESKPEEDTSVTTETVTELACEKEEHTHSDSCYSEGSGCEKEEHSHGDGCYEKTLSCEAEEHSHGEGCYSTTETMTCEAEEHSHGDGCYDEEGNLTCESDEHSHDGGCYETSEELTCSTEEHSHGDGCYTETLTCESEEHTHDDSCAASSELTCEAEEHTHDDSCYVEKEVEVEKEAEPEEVKEEPEEAPEPVEEQPTADAENTESQEAEEGHTHTDDCYETKTTMTCGEQELHIHDDSCYDESCFDEDGNLIEGSRVSCGLLQLEEHIHSDDCFKVVELTPEEVAALNEGANLHMHTEECFGEDGSLICGHEATHIHKLECYDEAGNLICGYGTATHVHEDSCYDEAGNLQCGYETATHVHEESCYDAEGNLQCGYETATHVHEDSCYDTEGNLICGYETATHVHEDSCYDAEGNLQCGYETATHVHEDSCYDAEGNLICGYKTAVHVHEDSCYDAEGNLICGYESAMEHEHDINCYDAEGNLICGYEDAKDHEHDSSCYDAEGNLICGYEGVKNHEHDASCYDEGFNLICGYKDAKDHEHDADCYDILGNLVCGYEGVENHVHTESCYDEEGNLICGYETLEAFDNRKVYQNEKYIVVVKYNDDAMIPQEAELVAEEITADSDEEHYGNREVEYREMLKDETASMRALLKIGFYLGEEEIEPVTPVMVTVQFLDESGLAEGEPIAIIHFGKEGTEKLDGGRAKRSSTTFKIKSFSEIAIGYGVEEPEKVTVPISNSFEYDDENFHATFHIEGEAIMSVPKKKSDSEHGEEVSVEETTVDDSINDITSDILDDKKETDNTENSEKSVETLSKEEKDEISSDTLAQSDEEGESEHELKFQVELLDENTDEYAQEYAAVIACTEELGKDDKDNTNLLRVLSYSLSCDGVKLDLSNCQVTVEIMPTQTLMDEAEEVIGETPDGEEIQSEVTLSVIEVVKCSDDVNIEKNTSDEISMDVEGEVASEENYVSSESPETDNLDEDTQVVGEIVDAKAINDMQQPILHTLRATGTDNTVAVYKSSQADPSFTVQYYANLNVVVKGTGGINPLEVIDTSNGGEGRKGILPQNGVTPPLTNIYLSKTNDTVDAGGGHTKYRHEVKTEEKLVEVYATGEPYHYVTAPGLTYFDKLAENGNYDLAQIWILKDGCDSESVSESDWRIYTLCGSKLDKSEGHKEGFVHTPEGELKSLHFTNKQETADSITDEDLFIKIEEGTVIRLVYDTSSKEVSNITQFYDYDISDGNVYKTMATEQNNIIARGKSKATPSGSHWYMYTEKQGINSDSNYIGKSGVHLAFGNSNTKTTLGYEAWNGNELNKGNTDGKTPRSYKGMTLNLVKSLKEDGTIEYNTGVAAPALFNEPGQPAGKTTYEDGSLTFRQEGDTYTMTSATVGDSKLSGLDLFNNPSKYSIWTNNFWPMDGVASAGTAGHDLMFGLNNTDTTTFSKTGYWNSNPYKDDPNSKKENTPLADDFRHHNPYFGMYYTVDFELTEDYVGPLEYLFYGDDDMWVFLSPIDKINGSITAKGELICDIGGVHSSIGEYVNLWDWIKKGNTGAYRLSFFYTERGASGSSCWMQFTLPSVSFSTPEQSTGGLRIEKQVPNIENDDEFGFEVILKDKNGVQLKDNYSYSRYKADGTKIKDDVLIWDGGSFELKAGEYVEINYLPIGTQYRITEIGPVVTETVTHPETGESIVQPKRDENGNYIRDEEADHYLASATGATNSSGVGASPEDKRIVEGTIKEQQSQYKIQYTNEYYEEYILPETGGPGMELYTIAGVLCILCGAGFLYKKKFRERRA